MKKLLIPLLLLILMPKANAASASISVYVSRLNLVVGQSVNVSVTVSSSDSLGSWEYDLKYDTSKLRLTYSSFGGTSVADVSNNEGTKKRTYNYTFVSTSRGSAKIYVANSRVVSFTSESDMNVTNGSKTLSIITQSELEASYSKNNYLKTLSVEGYELIPEFSKETTEYSVELEPLTKTVSISGTLDDTKSSISKTGEFDVVEGPNEIKINVTAQNGSVRTYTVNAIVKELEPIIVSINDLEYTVIRNKESITCDNLFEEKTIKINELDVPTCFNETTNYEIVYLRDEEGNIYPYSYSDNKYTEFQKLETKQLNIVYFEPNDLELTKKEIEINDIKVSAYQSDIDPNMFIIKGLNIETNEENYYQYDTKEETLQRYNVVEEEEQLPPIITLVLIIAAASLLFTVIVLIIYIIRIKSKTNIKKFNLD